MVKTVFFFVDPLRGSEDIEIIGKKGLTIDEHLVTEIFEKDAKLRRICFEIPVKEAHAPIPPIVYKRIPHHTAEHADSPIFTVHRKLFKSKGKDI